MLGTIHSNSRRVVAHNFHGKVLVANRSTSVKITAMHFKSNTGNIVARYRAQSVYSTLKTPLESGPRY